MTRPPMMDDSRKKALRKYHPDLRTGIIVTHFLPNLHVDAGGFLTDVESDGIKKNGGNVEQVDELIDVLVKKEDKDFDYFCVVLEKAGCQAWSNRLKEAAGLISPRRHASEPVGPPTPLSPLQRKHVQGEVTPGTLATCGPPSAVVRSQSKISVWKSQPDVRTLLDDLTMGDVATAKQTREREKEMELLRQTVKESDEKCLQLLEEKLSVEKKWNESEEKLASLGTEVQQLSAKNTSLEEDNSRLKKESSVLLEKLSTMEREKSVHDDQVRQLVRKNTSLEEDNSRLRREKSELSRRSSTVERELEEKCSQLLEEKRSIEKKWNESEEKLASLGNEVQQLVGKSTFLEEDNRRLRKEMSELSGRLSTMERESVHSDLIQQLVDNNTSLEKDNSRLKREMSDQSERLSTMERERSALEEDFHCLKREKSYELDYVKQKLTAEQEANRTLQDKISSMDEKLAKDICD